jgi:hypothetical protein
MALIYVIQCHLVLSYIVLHQPRAYIVLKCTRELKCMLGVLLGLNTAKRLCLEALGGAEVASGNSKDRN